MQGNPWTGYAEEAVAARRLICGLLSTLHGQGWVLTLSTDISKKTSDKDTLLFRHQSPAPAPCNWCCIGFSKKDRIKLIDVPTEVVNALIPKLGRRIQSHNMHSQGVYELKLVGNPWRADGTETMRVRELLLTLMEVLEGEGWTVYASVDQKNGADEHTETDTVSFPSEILRKVLIYRSGIAVSLKDGKEVLRSTTTEMKLRIQSCCTCQIRLSFIVGVHADTRSKSRNEEVK